VRGRRALGGGKKTETQTVRRERRLARLRGCAPGTSLLAGGVRDAQRAGRHRALRARRARRRRRRVPTYARARTVRAAFGRAREKRKREPLWARRGSASAPPSAPSGACAGWASPPRSRSRNGPGKRRACAGCARRGGGKWRTRSRGRTPG
jgi:hypothetical protein